jgi:glutamate--cysteine ligase
LALALASRCMIYRHVNGTYVPGPRLPFGKLLESGFDDGVRVSIADWETHLRQVWPAVRPRQTLETRLPDGQQWSSIAVIPALFVGLVEEAPIRSKVLSLLGQFSASDLDAVVVAGSRYGWAGLSGETKDLIRELLVAASDGLATRVSDGVEPGDLPIALDPVLEVAESGVSIADNLADLWNGRCNRDPVRYVSALAVPTS